MKKELLTEIKRIKEIMFLKEGLGSQFARIITSNIGMQDTVRRFLQNTTIFADDAQKAANIMRFDSNDFDVVLDNLSAIFLFKFRNLSDDKVFAEFDNLMSALDPSYLGKMRADAANSSVDDIVLRTSYLDSDVGEMYMKRVLKQRSTMGGGGGAGGGSGKSVRDDVENYLKSPLFKKFYRGNADQVVQTLKLLSNDLNNINSIDELMSTWLPKVIKQIEQNVQNSIQLQNLTRKEKEAAAATRAQGFLTACQNFATRLKGTKQVAGEATDINYTKLMKRMALWFLVVALIGVISIVDKETLLGIAREEGWETIKGLPGEAWDLIRKKEEEQVKVVSDTVKIMQDTLMNSEGQVSDVENVPVITPDQNNPDGVRVTTEPFDPDKQDTTPTDTDTIPTGTKKTKTTTKIITMNKPEPTSKGRFT